MKNKRIIISIIICIFLSGCNQTKKAKVIKPQLFKPTIISLSTTPVATTNDTQNDLVSVQSIEHQLEVEQAIIEEAKKPTVSPITNAVTVKAPSRPITPPQPINNSTTVVFETDMENQVLVLLNTERNRLGLSSLVMNDSLRNSARLKSKEMCVNNYFDHLSLITNQYVDGELKSLGISAWTACAENILYIKQKKLSNISAQEIFNMWMNLPGHKTNMLNPVYTKIGMGISWRDSDENLEATQQFIDK